MAHLRRNPQLLSCEIYNKLWFYRIKAHIQGTRRQITKQEGHHSSGEILKILGFLQSKATHSRNTTPESKREGNFVKRAQRELSSRKRSDDSDGRSVGSPGLKSLSDVLGLDINVLRHQSVHLGNGRRCDVVKHPLTTPTLLEVRQEALNAPELVEAGVTDCTAYPHPQWVQVAVFSVLVASQCRQ